MTTSISRGKEVIIKKSLILITIVTIISALILICAIRNAQPYMDQASKRYTYESDIDPEVMNVWPKIRIELARTPHMKAIVVCKNPDPAHPIKKVAFLLILNYSKKWFFHEYAYYKNGILELYRGKDTEKGRHYYRIDPVPADKKEIIDTWLKPSVGSEITPNKNIKI